jgi:hypothetical protein
MEPYLTLIIALGGIATGIGAIWTAMLARRQAKDQRKFLQDQNERDRRRLEADLMHGMWTKWTSRAYLDFSVGDQVIPLGCDHVIPQVVGPW